MLLKTNKQMRGALIVIEGIDGAGKTTLAESLKSVIPISFRFPDRKTEIGKVISKILTNNIQINEKALQLLFSANRWERSDEMKEYIEKGTNILLDRYIYSGIAYGRENYCFEVDKHLPEADLVLFLNITPEQVLSRKVLGSELFDDLQTQNRAYAEYLQLKKRNENWVDIDATKPISNIFNTCQLIVRAFLEKLNQ